MYSIPCGTALEAKATCWEIREENLHRPFGRHFHPCSLFIHPVALPTLSFRRDAAGPRTAQFFVAGTALGTEGYLAPLVPLTTSHTIGEPRVLPGY